MLISIMRKNGDVEVFDSSECMMVYALSMEERAQIVDVGNRVAAKGGLNNAFHVSYKGRPRTADEDAEFRRRQMRTKQALESHPRCAAYVNEPANATETESQRILMPGGFKL